jgi:hypothetical protein
MGAIDHLVLAMGISLSRLNGRDHETTADEAHSQGSDPAADEARKAGRYVRIHSI